MAFNPGSLKLSKTGKPHEKPGGAIKPQARVVKTIKPQDFQKYN
jgi:hypothetical protein